MALPFNPDAIKRNARAYGFNTQQAAIFTHLALDKLRDLHNESNQPVTLEQIAEAIKDYATEEVEREKAISPEVRKQGISIIDDMEANIHLLNRGPGGGMPVPVVEPEVLEEEQDGMPTKRFKFDDDGLEHYFGKECPYNLQTGFTTLSLKHHHRDIITALCTRVEIAVELGKQLRPEDLVTLYATSKMFHAAINEHLLSSIRMWIADRAPEAGRVFKFKLYRKLLVPDPGGRTWGLQYEGTEMQTNNPGLMRQVRTVPGLRYLQLVLVRDRCCRQIIAIMARNGFLMPKSMHHTLLRLWLLMDIPTTGQRHALLRNRQLWTDEHLYNAQLLFMKLSMMFNDPIYGPFSNELLHVTLGQKGLFPLWQLLMQKKFTTLSEILELKVRYNFDTPVEVSGGGTDNESTIHGVPIQYVGTGHYEGWGLGDKHLQRPDELIPVEAVARGLQLDDHLMYMMTWGYLDFTTGENIVPSEQDMYISDEEETLKHMDTTGHWQKKHALKKRFAQLSSAEQQKILEDDEDDRLRALAWTGDITDYVDHAQTDQPGSVLDDEIRRGYIVRPQPQGDDKMAVPDMNNKQAWVDFANAALTTIPVELSEEQTLRAQAWENYHEAETDSDWDWQAWLAQEEARVTANTAPASSDSDEVDDGETVILGEYEPTDEDDTANPQDGVDEGYENESDDDDDEENMTDYEPVLVELSDYFGEVSDGPLSEDLLKLLQELAPELGPA
ncbi:hypothetical protein QQS21_010950 [Conoideocrella luteorostrata]|uniref:Uncharacterized protein n=1 Tax=Conoideocrella luteorostrata TaxID=1105319 RepID=A0AAJ0CIH3_9HYPO|nr:hypothetical protein QQS21_010950 [Conoideocrella luteorostrata]